MSCRLCRCPHNLDAHRLAGESERHRQDAAQTSKVGDCPLGYINRIDQYLFAYCWSSSTTIEEVARRLREQGHEVTPRQVCELARSMRTFGVQLKHIRRRPREDE